MSRPARIALFVLLANLLGVSSAADDFAFFHENVLGTSLELRVTADDEAAASRAEGRVLGEIDRLAAIFSGYDQASEFSRWQSRSKGPTPVSPELFEVLRTSDHWRARSGGAFDPRVEILTRLWSSAAVKDRTPNPEERARAIATMQGPAWRLDPYSRTAERLSDCPLSFNAIAKGFIVERACDAALSKGDGVRGLLLNLGGDLRVVGEPARRVGISSPRADSETSEPLTTIEVRDRAVATSGNSQRGLRIKGKWYSHIFDPRTGLPADGIACATVIAERSADADALATILNVLPPEEGLRLAESVPGVDCLIVASDGRIVRSGGWHAFEKTPPKLLAFQGEEKGEPKALPGGSWGDDFELVVEFEINRPEGEAGPYRRPFVAVWVEDKNGATVRNLALWLSRGGSGPFEWLPDLKRWYRSDRARRRVDKTDMVQTISRPTRPPGKYSLIWDGKDDHGRPLPVGEYTISIDAAREHGTYQGIRTPVTLANRPFAEELKGNVEIKTATIGYRRKAQAK